MRLSPNILSKAVLLTAMFVAAPVRGHGIIFGIAPDNRIQSGWPDPVTGDPAFPVRVFAAWFGELPDFTNDPGFDSEVGTFSPGSVNGFNIRRALRLWNGVDFNQIPDEQIEMRFGPLGPISTPTDDTPVEGFGLSVSPGGIWHHHIGFTLTQPARAGIYLLELELWSDQPGLLTSDPFWIVFNQNEPDSVLDEAIAWVQDHLAGGGSCPGDVNGDGTLDVRDFFAFVSLFAIGDPAADLNADGRVDVLDFFFFVSAFAQSCP